MDIQKWNECQAPLEMVHYLEDAGCYLEFIPFFTNCFERIRHEFHNSTIAETVFNLQADVDELTDAARLAIDEMEQQLAAFDDQSEEWEKLNREIYFSRSVLARDYHDFGEANRFLSRYLVEIADDPEAEAKTQADFLRANYAFPFQPAEED